MRLATLSLMACLAGTGCLIPDRSQLEIDAGIDDGGIDAPDTGDDPDTGPDADTGMPDACIGNQLRETACENGDDDDCDGLVDCNDVDCGRDLACCDEDLGTPALTTRFGGTALPSDWISLPIGAEPPIVPTGEPFLRVFGTPGNPRAARLDRCLSIDLGVVLSATLRAPYPMTCSDDEEERAETCPYAAIVLTATTDMGETSLPDELSVRLYGDRHLEVRSAGDVIVARSAPFGTEQLDLDIELTPGLAENGEAYVHASVTATQAGVPQWVAFPEGPKPVIPRSYLRGSDVGCDAARGLFLAAEGVGDDVHVVAIDGAAQICANPSHFRPNPRAEIEAEDVRADPSWSSGGIGEPALVSYIDEEASDPAQWALLYDATNQPRLNERDATLRFSVGVSATGDPNGLGEWTSGANPLLGNDPPQCTGTGCPDPDSVREPGVFLPLDEELRTLVGDNGVGILVYAREIPFSGGRSFGIEARRMFVPSESVENNPQPLVMPDSQCTSLRDPSLLPTAPGVSNRLWLLFGCERNGVLNEIQMAELTVTTGALTIRDRATVLTAADFGPSASLSLRAADGAAWFLDDRVVYRLWATVRDRGGATGIAYAEASGPIGERPVFVPYAANPVLRFDDDVFGDCDEATTCTIDSVGVTRIANQSHRVRLMVARTIREPTEVRHVLVPLDQVWPRPRE